MAEVTHRTPTRTARPRLSLWHRVVAVVGVGMLLIGVVVGWLWLGPIGAGESGESPDGKYAASAFNYSQATIWGNQPVWDEIRVTEKKTGRVVWHVKRPALPGTTPDYGMRGVRFVEWAADSSAVSVDIGGGQKVTLPVP